MRNAIACLLAILAGAAALLAEGALAGDPAQAQGMRAHATRTHTRPAHAPSAPAASARAARAHAAPARAAPAHAAPAHAARALNITDTAHLRFVRETAGSALVDEGKATGGLPGTVKVVVEVGATVKASFTLSSRDGELIGSGAAKPHSSGETYSSFAGTLTITHGTGRYVHAHGRGGFYGVIDRNNDAVTVQTTGTLQY